jgi:transposase
MPQAVARLPEAPALSREARHRLTILDYARTHSVAATCRHFGIARSTYYRWAKRYDPQRLSVLENRSSAPRRVRRPTWTPQHAAAVRQARERYPRWGKDKLAVVLRREGIILSVSMIGRILTDLKRRGVLIEPRPTRLRPHARHARPYARRKPQEPLVARPGDLVQLDTMHLTPVPGVERRHFSAVDLISRWSVAGVRSCATAGTARDFLDELDARLPFPIRAIQVDGGSEFMAEFEAACQERGIPLFVLPPRSPQAQWARRTDQPHPSLRVLGTLRRRSRVAAAASGAAGLGGDGQSRPAAPSLGLPHPRRAPRHARHPPGVADVPNENIVLTSISPGAKVGSPRRGQFQTSPSAVFSPLVGAPDIAVPLSRCV